MNNIKKGSTTIAIPIEISERIEAYCKLHGLLKKDFVQLALDCIETNNIDITENIVMQSLKKEVQPLQTALNKLEEVRSTMEQANQDHMLVRDLIALVNQNNQEQQKLLMAIPNKSQLESTEEENRVLKEKLKLALNELRSCSGRWSKANPEVLKELGINN